MRKYLVIIFIVSILSRKVFATSYIVSSISTIDAANNVFNEVISYKNQNSVYLSKLQESEVFGTIKKVDNITTKDMTYNNGIVCDKDTIITYDLGKKYKRFTSYVSVLDSVKPLLIDKDINGVNLKIREPLGKVQFSIFVDDALCYFSSVINCDSMPEYVDISVHNKSKLVIVIKNIDGNFLDAALLEPTLYKNDILNYLIF